MNYFIRRRRDGGGRGEVGELWTRLSKVGSQKASGSVVVSVARLSSSAGKNFPAEALKLFRHAAASFASFFRANKLVLRLHN